MDFLCSCQLFLFSHIRARCELSELRKKGKKQQMKLELTQSRSFQCLKQLRIFASRNTNEGENKKKWNMKNNMVTQLCIEQWFTNQLYQFVEINNKRFITFHAREYAMCEYIQMILPEIQIFNNWILPIFLGYFVNIGEWRVPWNLYPNETTQQNASSSYSMSFVSFTKAYNAYTYACTVNLQVTFAIQFTMILGKRQISIAPITGGIKIRCKYDRRSNELIQF